DAVKVTTRQVRKLYLSAYTPFQLELFPEGYLMSSIFELHKLKKVRASFVKYSLMLHRSTH
ncbi:hypothetical protein QT520_25205, partial [Klebsiella pneumoniae]|nr:hypothetical protein [Klebsiella pneumoniae]